MPRDRTGRTILGKYTIVRPIGEGATGVVYEARHRNGRPFALKFLAPALNAVPELRARFLRGACASNAVGHSRVVTVLDDDVDEEGAAFFVMELVRGDALFTRAARLGGCVRETFFLTAVRDLLGVLSAAHEKGIVHGHIDAKHLVWDDETGLRVLGFGTGWMRSVDPRADLWAVAAMIRAALDARVLSRGARRLAGRWPTAHAMLAAVEAVLAALAGAQSRQPSRLLARA